MINKSVNEGRRVQTIVFIATSSFGFLLIRHKQQYGQKVIEIKHSVFLDQKENSKSTGSRLFLLRAEGQLLPMSA